MNEKKMLEKEITMIVMKMIVGAVIGVIVANIIGYPEMAFSMAIMFSGVVEGWKVVNNIFSTYIGLDMESFIFSLFFLLVKIMISAALGFFLSIGKLIISVVKYVMVRRSL